MIRYAKNEGNMSQSTERDFEMTAITTPPNKDLTSHYKYIPYITESKEKWLLIFLQTVYGPVYILFFFWLYNVLALSLRYNVFKNLDLSFMASKAADIFSQCFWDVFSGQMGLDLD